ncbi:MAG: V-type ATP synthase subunit E [Methanoregula sp.]|uniref:V-type ATP synthase subunit E n=1 Tax=Methanoregula sp. TaxID=2052170 RepID=UPI003C73E6B0
MAYENLLKSVEESALEKERELQKNAKKQADAIRFAAKEQAEKIQELTIKEAETSAAIERNKQLFLAKGAIKEQALKSREKVFEAAFEAAGQQLSRLRQDDTYPAVFRRLAEETASAMGETPFVVHIDPRDLDLCKNTLAVLKISCEIRADLECMGGLVASSPDGHITISNTIESRLERVREHKRLEIYAVLAGG